MDELMEFKPPFIDVTYHREDYLYKSMQTDCWKGVSSMLFYYLWRIYEEETENALIDLNLGIDNVLVLAEEHGGECKIFISRQRRNAFLSTDLAGAGILLALLLPVLSFAQKTKKPTLLVYGNDIEAFSSALQSAKSGVATLWVVDQQTLVPSLTRESITLAGQHIWMQIVEISAVCCT
ncbi:hypothetical protein FQR65_LT19621 [Abscondita terminalis]|nr:hypothetical protein FQR65_LT19621 [Abscondita terminalis]